MITMQSITAVGLIYLIGINLAGFIIMIKKEPSGVPGASRRLLFF